MKTSLFFDIQFGVSGDMLVASLIDLGLNVEKLRSELAKLNLNDWSIQPSRTEKYHFHGVTAGITARDGIKERNITEIKKIISESRLPDTVINNVLTVFAKLAEAEAKVHNTDADSIHFHETGATDSIIDITAFCIGLYLLKVDAVYFNEFNFGTGSVKSRHGELPVPVPAVLELCQGYKSRSTERLGEQVTPTGAALLTSLGKQMSQPGSFIIKNVGIGFGTRLYPHPSYVRAILIEKTGTDSVEIETIFQVELNIDDMNPQLYPYIFDKLFEAGALDVYSIPIGMKKGRPGMLLTVLCYEDRIDVIKELLYTETTTLGLRYFPVTREKLQRSLSAVKEGNLSIRIKKGLLNDRIINAQPEYEDCLKVAVKEKRPLKEIILKALLKSLK